MHHLNSPILALAALVTLVWLGYTYYPSNRPTCESLGRCNLSTGEVYDMEAIEQAKTYATLFEEK